MLVISKDLSLVLGYHTGQTGRLDMTAQCLSLAIQVSPLLRDTQDPRRLFPTHKLSSQTTHLIRCHQEGPHSRREYL